MAAKLKIQAPILSSYSAGGATLKDIWKKILKSGPIDPNDKKHVAFLTTTELSFDPDKGRYEGDGRITVHRATGWFEATAKVKDLELNLLTYIDCPKAQMSKLSKPAQKEWKRFFDRALRHEGEHHVKAKDESSNILKEINALRGSGLGETQEEAANAAIDDLKTIMFDTYIGGAMDDRLNRIHKDFDKSTKHGEKTGAKLDTTIA